MIQVIEATSTNTSPDISLKKKEMIELGEKYGLADERTLTCSQELDDLLNRDLYEKELCFSG